MSAILKQIGLDDQKYNTHSFRIGVATSAKAAGVSDSHIKMLGRWQSSAYQLLIYQNSKGAASSTIMATDSYLVEYS